MKLDLLSDPSVVGVKQCSPPLVTECDCELGRPDDVGEWGSGEDALDFEHRTLTSKELPLPRRKELDSPLSPLRDFERKVAEGKSKKEAIRSLKRHVLPSQASGTVLAIRSTSSVRF